jgi:hypothetical protein
MGREGRGMMLRPFLCFEARQKRRPGAITFQIGKVTVHLLFTQQKAALNLNVAASH